MKNYSLMGPTVVNATLNSLTNELEISRSPPFRSEFNFGASDNQSSNWAFDTERDWDSAPGVHEKGWKQQADYENATPDRFSTKESTTTFRLNLEIDDTPVFSKVTDYTSFCDKHIIPDFDDIITAEELKEPEEWENRDYRLPFPDIPVNRVKAPYDSVDQYLHTHFELMRHDFLIPLQKAVKAYKEMYNHAKTKEDQGTAMETASSQQSYRLYEHVVTILVSMIFLFTKTD
jgi:hypothetical protein